MALVKIDGYRCNKCRHVWAKRANTEGDPLICPHCKTPRWNL